MTVGIEMDIKFMVVGENHTTVQVNTSYIVKAHLMYGILLLCYDVFPNIL